MDYKEIVENRRAVNFFDEDRDVPGDLLREMVELAAKAPSSFNLQPWNLMILKDAGERLRL